MWRKEKMSRVTWNRTAAFNSSLLLFLSHFKERARFSRIKSSSGKQARGHENHKIVRGLRPMRTLNHPEEPRQGSHPPPAVGPFWVSPVLLVLVELCWSRAGLHLCLHLVPALPAVGSPSAERTLWTCAPGLVCFCCCQEPSGGPWSWFITCCDGTANGPCYQLQPQPRVQLLWATGLSVPPWAWPSWPSQLLS